MKKPALLLAIPAQYESYTGTSLYYSRLEEITPLPVCLSGYLAFLLPDMAVVSGINLNNSCLLH
ncbi:hypothetical protein WJR50_17710 [Catalinimonas sp. 4WD22]|uniref:hypothetical protein n=1 Tax=Catalinimonas locisalis TaxID=3133978 RepID=UPI003100C644